MGYSKAQIQTAREMLAKALYNSEKTGSCEVYGKTASKNYLVNNDICTGDLSHGNYDTTTYLRLNDEGDVDYEYYRANQPEVWELYLAHVQEDLNARYDEYEWWVNLKANRTAFLKDYKVGDLVLHKHTDWGDPTTTLYLVINKTTYNLNLLQIVQYNGYRKEFDFHHCRRDLDTTLGNYSNVTNGNAYVQFKPEGAPYGYEIYTDWNQSTVVRFNLTIKTIEQGKLVYDLRVYTNGDSDVSYRGYGHDCGVSILDESKDLINLVKRYIPESDE